MHNPYFDLIRTVWRHGTPWRKSIVAYYFAYILAQGVWDLYPYAFGRAINLLQHFKPELLSELVLWLLAGIGRCHPCIPRSSHDRFTTPFAPFTTI